MASVYQIAPPLMGDALRDVMAKRKKIDWEGIEKDNPDLLLWKIKPGEAGVAGLIRRIIFHQLDAFSVAIGVSKVATYEFEFPVPRGRVDLILFHIDGSISVIEIKNKLDKKQIVAGIGQLSMYAVQIGFSRTHTEIRKILIAPLDSKDPNTLLIHMACEDAGVQFVPLGTIAEHQQIWDKLVLQVINGGEKT